MNRIIIVLGSPKVAKLVGLVTKDLPRRKVEGYTSLSSAKATLGDPLRLDIRVIVIGDVVEAEKAEARKWAQWLYEEGYTVIWFSAVKPPLDEIAHVVKKEPVIDALEELGALIKQALKTKK